MNYLKLIAFSKYSVLFGHASTCPPEEFPKNATARFHACLRLAEDISSMGFIKMLSLAVLDKTDLEYQETVSS